MVCVCKLSLDESIISGGDRKVNSPGKTFTICLQERENLQFYS